MHCLTALGQWAVEILQYTATLPGGSGQCSSCNALTASLPRGSGQCNLCNALPHCLGAVYTVTPAVHRLTALGAVGSATPATHCLTAWAQYTL